MSDSEISKAFRDWVLEDMDRIDELVMDLYRSSGLDTAAETQRTYDSVLWIKDALARVRRYVKATGPHTENTNVPIRTEVL